jgi:hypothetical protein
VIVKLRHLRMTAAEIAETLAMPLSTVSAVLTRAGIGRLGRTGLEPAVRYERSRPGELIHIDSKKLGRSEGGAGHRVGGRIGRGQRHQYDTHGRRHGTTGWEFVHVAVDDYSRLAYTEVLPDERATTTPASSAALAPSSPATASTSNTYSPTDESQVDGRRGWWDPFARVRVIDEAKRRPLGFPESAARLCPSRAYVDARPGVTPAPAFAGPLDRQSLTRRR